MPVGFGNEPAGRGPRGLRADTPLPSQGDDLRAIRQRYCGPGTLRPTPFSLAANAGIRFDLTGTPVNYIVLTTLTGQVRGWFSDNSSQFGVAAIISDFVGSASVDVNTIVIPVPPGENYVFSIQEGAGSTTTGSITFGYQ